MDDKITKNTTKSKFVSVESKALSDDFDVPHHGDRASVSMDKPAGEIIKDELTASNSYIQLNTVSSRSTLFSINNIPVVKFQGDVLVSWSIQIDVSKGSLDLTTGVRCAIVNAMAGASAKIKWTGIPQLDYVIEESGRSISNFIIMALFECPVDTKAAFSLNMDLSWNTDILSDTNPTVWGIISSVAYAYNPFLGSATISPVAATQDSLWGETSRTKRHIEKPVVETPIYHTMKAVMQEPSPQAKPEVLYANVKKNPTKLWSKVLSTFGKKRDI